MIWTGLVQESAGSHSSSCVAGAIIDYLVRSYGKGKGLRPDESSSDRTAYDFWLHFAEGSAMTPILLAFYFAKMASPETAANVKKTAAHPAIQNQVKFMEGELEKTTYFAGSKFSAADCQMSFVVELLEAGGFIGKSQPKLTTWVSTIRARPAYKKALQRGGEENYQLSAFKDMLQ